MKTRLMKVFLKVTKTALSYGKGVLSTVRVKDGIASVTDGHRMFQFPVPGVEDNLYEHKKVELQTTTASAQKTDVDLGLVEPVTDGWGVHQYPNADQLFPNTNGMTRLFINARYLKDLCDAAIAGKRAEVLLFIPEESTKAKCITQPVIGHFFIDDEKTVARALIMPIQLREDNRSLEEFNPIVRPLVAA